MEEQKRQACPCCGTTMKVTNETETKVSLKCSSCGVSDIRVK